MTCGTMRPHTMFIDPGHRLVTGCDRPVTRSDHPICPIFAPAASSHEGPYLDSHEGPYRDVLLSTVLNSPRSTTNDHGSVIIWRLGAAGGGWGGWGGIWRLGRLR